jgi:hypothetical protein
MTIEKVTGGADMLYLGSRRLSPRRRWISCMSAKPPSRDRDILVHEL